MLCDNLDKTLICVLLVLSYKFKASKSETVIFIKVKYVYGHIYI
jgi:hypothetical protein